MEYSTYTFLVLAVFSALVAVDSGTIRPIKKLVDNANLAIEATSTSSSISKDNVSVLPPLENLRKGRSRSNTYADFLSCAIARNMGCFLDTADDYLAEKKNELLAQAEAESRALGRADATSPSHLSSMLSRLLSELTDMFKDGISGLFRTTKEGEDDDETVEESADVADKKNTSVSARSSDLEPRKKKKHGKIKRLVKLIKLLIFGAVIAIKLALLLQFASVAIKFKFLLIALAALALKAASFWVQLKKGHSPQKVIYYEHAQHQHHYEGGEDDWAHSSPGGGGYWGRSYEVEDGKASAQDLAYAKQKPSGTAYSRVDNKPNYSWTD